MLNILYVALFVKDVEVRLIMVNCKFLPYTCNLLSQTKLRIEHALNTLDYIKFKVKNAIAL